MKVDSALLVTNPAEAGAEARRLEELGYDGGFSYDGPRDPFFPLAMAARETRQLELSTAIAVAFARSPMLLAQIANDLQTLSGGRFLLGLGSQIRPHIERRFSMPWSKPAERMRELIQAIRAIWACWNQGEKLDFRGEFYTHTLMTPFFDPGPNPHGLPPIFLAGVGPRMTEVAGEVADGFLAHPFHTTRFIQETTLPALERGARKAGRGSDGVEISVQVMVVTGSNDEERAKADQMIRHQIGFYASTPAYKLVLDAHGWGELQPELNRMTKRGRWNEIAAAVSDEILDEIAIREPIESLAARVKQRYGHFASRVSLVAPYLDDPAILAPTLQALREK